MSIDMQPFSENTTLLFHEAAKVDRPFQFKSLATYKDIEQYKDLKIKAQPIIVGLKGIAYYSNQVVAISNSSISEKNKNIQLANYIEEVLEKLEHKKGIGNHGISQKRIDSTLNLIRNSETYLKGIKAADPMAKSIVVLMNFRLDQLENMIVDVVSSFEAQILTDFEFTIENYYALKELQDITQSKLTKLYFAQTGQYNLIDSLLVSDASLAKFLNKNDPKNQTNFDNAESFLMKRLENIDIMLQQLVDDKQQFTDMKNEIGEWHLQVDEKIKITRNSLIIWSRSHKNLGNGVVTPAILGIENLSKVVFPAIKSVL